MRIIVTIKQILDPDGITVNRRRERIFVNREEYIINSADTRALEAALQLKDDNQAEVIALSLGPARADDALREALAMGADSAYLLSDEWLESGDASVAARALARAIEKIGGYDLILTGQMSADTGAEEMGGRLAQLLGLPQVQNALEIRAAEERLIVVRVWDRERVQVSVPLPALVSISNDAPPARYPHGARIMNAYREWNVTTWTSSDLDMAEDELTPLVESRGPVFPPARELGNILSGSPAETAREVVEQLRSRRLV